MKDSQPDLLAQLRQLRDELAPDDERMLVIEELIRDKMRVSGNTSAEAMAAPAVASTAEATGAAAADRTNSCEGQIALPRNRPTGLQRYPTQDIVISAPRGRIATFAAVFGLVIALAVGTSLCVLF